MHERVEEDVVPQRLAVVREPDPGLLGQAVPGEERVVDGVEQRREREEEVEREPGQDVEPADVARVTGRVARRRDAGACAARPDLRGPGAPRVLALHPPRAVDQRSVLSNFAQSSWTALAMPAGVWRPASRSWNWFWSVVYMDGEAQSV